MNVELSFATNTTVVSGKFISLVLRYFNSENSFSLFNIQQRQKVLKLDKIRINIDMARAESSFKRNEVGPKARGPGIIEFSKIRFPMIIGRNPDAENMNNNGFVLDVALPYAMGDYENGITKSHLFVCVYPNMRYAIDVAYRKFLLNKDRGNIPVFDIGGNWSLFNVPDVKIVGFVDRIEMPLSRVRLLKQNID